MRLRMTTGLLALSLAVALSGGSALADDACEGHSKRQRLTKLGGPNAFGDAVDDLAALQSAFETRRDDIVFLLETQGLIDAAPGLFEAVREGRVTERNLDRGETFQWMAYSWKGKPKLTDNLCFDTDDAYGAWEVSVVLGELEPAQCQISATASCDFQNEMAMVDASGSSAGVKVVQDGGATLIANVADGSTWKGGMSDPYRKGHTYTAMADEGPEQEVRKITLVIPKVCFNISLASDEAVMMASPGCSESTSLSCPVTTPSCSIAVGNDNPWTNEDVEIGVTGEWPGNQMEVEVVDANGVTVAEPVFSAPYPNTVKFGRAGVYTLNGTATNEIGETATCSSQIGVDSRWTLRPLLHSASPDDDMVMRSQAAAPPAIQERTKFTTDNGQGLEAALEYHVNDRVGIEGRVSHTRFEGIFTFDIDDNWEMGDDDLTVTSLTVGPDFHLTPTSRLDLFLTPFLGYAKVGDLNYTLLGRSFNLDLDDQFTWGLALGLDVPLGEATPWNLSFSARYMDLEADAGTHTVGMDPLFIGAGFAYDF